MQIVCRNGLVWFVSFDIQANALSTVSLGKWRILFCQLLLATRIDVASFLMIGHAFLRRVCVRSLACARRVLLAGHTPVPCWLGLGLSSLLKAFLDLHAPFSDVLFQRSL